MNQPSYMTPDRKSAPALDDLTNNGPYTRLAFHGKARETRHFFREYLLAIGYTVPSDFGPDLPIICLQPGRKESPACVGTNVVEGLSSNFYITDSYFTATRIVFMEAFPPYRLRAVFDDAEPIIVVQDGEIYIEDVGEKHRVTDAAFDVVDQLRDEPKITGQFRVVDADIHLRRLDDGRATQRTISLARLTHAVSTANAQYWHIKHLYGADG